MCISTDCITSAFRLSPSSGSSQPSGGDTQSFYFCRMPESSAAIQHKADSAGQEVEHRNKINIGLIFTIKFSMLTAYRISLHDTLNTQHRAVSPLLLWMEANCCWFYGYILREFANPDLVGIDRRRSRQPACSGAGPQPLRIWWK